MGYGGNAWVATTGYFSSPYWQAQATTRDEYWEDFVGVNSRGFNVSGGWHETGAGSCSIPVNDPNRTCSTVRFNYDATQNQTPYNGRYATTEHAIIWSSGSEYHYTSTTGVHSTWLCYARPGC